MSSSNFSLEDDSDYLDKIIKAINKDWKSASNKEKEEILVWLRRAGNILANINIPPANLINLLCITNAMTILDAIIRISGLPDKTNERGLIAYLNRLVYAEYRAKYGVPIEYHKEPPQRGKPRKITSNKDMKNLDPFAKRCSNCYHVVRKDNMKGLCRDCQRLGIRNGKSEH